MTRPDSTRRAVLLLALAASLPSIAAEPASRPPLAPAQVAALDAELRTIAADPAIPLASISALAIRNGRVAYRYQTGYKRLPLDGAPGQLADRATMYRIASLSKLVTSLGVMRLVEEGRLDLDADVSRYLGYRLRNPHFPDRAITLRMLMSHTSSLRDDAGYSWDGTVRIRDVLLPGGAEHGTGAMWARDHGPGYFKYVNLNWGVIGTVMEKASGERFDRLMQRLVFKPMDMRGGFYPAEFTPAQLADLAVIYRKRTADEREVWDPRGPWIAQVDDYRTQPPQPRPGTDGYAIGENGTLFGPQGGLRASAEDLGKLMLMMMHGGRHEGRRFLRPGSLAQLTARVWTRDDAAGNGDPSRGLFNAWGLGNQHFLDISRTETGGKAAGDRLVEGGGFRAIGHLGDAWGLKSAFVYDPAARNGMIYLTGGPGDDPERHPGAYSSLYRFEERILSAMHRHALAPR